MRKILVDLYKVKNEYSGLGQFSLQFANYLSEHYAHEFEFHFLVPGNMDHKFSSLIKLKKINPILKYWKLGYEQYDLWHSLHQFYSYAPPKSFKQLLTIHDLNYLEEKDQPKQLKYRKRLKQEIERANWTTSISNFTKHQIKQYFSGNNKTIDVIHNGVEFLPDFSPTRPKVKIGDKFFFSISLFTKKKNFEVLIPMMKHFPDYKLVLAGNHHTEYGSRIKKLIRKNGLEEQIKLPGKIPRSEKIYYMKLCNAFLFPSIAEGFGMPPIEAMQFGKPVFLSNACSLPEIGGDAAYYFRDFEPNNMAMLIKNKLYEFEQNPYDNGNKMIAQAKKFTLKASMEKYVKLYQRLTNLG